MASTFELLSQIMAETAEGSAATLSCSAPPPQMMLVHKATVAGFGKMRSDLERLRELSKSPRIDTWLANNRDRNCRDGGSISTLVELLDLLRSMT